MLIAGCARSHPYAPTPAATASAASPACAPYDPTAVQKSVEFHAGKTRENPRSAMEYGLLAGAYLQRCRETGDIGDARLAEQAARRSLALRARHNGGAQDTLALCLLTLHRFGEARALAEQAARQGALDPQAAALLIECQIEQGAYTEAQRALDAVSGRDSDTPIFNTLRARMRTLRGDPSGALALLARAEAQADRQQDMPAPNVAWFHMRRGDCLAAMGRVSEAETAYHAALALFPRDYRTLTALCRLAAGRSDWPAAISWGRQAADIAPLPDTLALLVDAYQATGNREEARRQLRLLDTVARLSRASGALYDRQRALFSADHDRDLPEALALARREMNVRQDIYAFDTLAWACFKNHRLDEAATAMQRALSLDTQDALLFYHAGCIACARGETQKGRAWLERALALNPYFHPTAPANARRLLARLPSL